MKLYMKQKVFTFKEKFTIKNEDGTDKYFVEGELLSIGHKLHIKNTDNVEVAFIKQKIMTLLPKFEVYIDGELKTSIQKKLTFVNPKYTLEGLSWEIKGDIFAHDYQIIDNGKTLVSIKKAWVSFGDSYEIDIIDEADEIFILATVLAIDCVLETNHSN